MTKKEAIELFVSRDFHPISQDWVKIIAEAKDEEIYSWPMWGTMWIVDDFIGKKLMKNSRAMVGEASEIDLNSITDEKERAAVRKAVKELKAENVDWAGVAILEDYVDEEMAGANNIIGTAAYLYEIDGEYVVGVHGAGWNFYDGVWDRLYDLIGLKWHENEPTT